MPSKRELFNQLVLSEFRNSANSTRILASKLGIEDYTADQWVNRALAGDDILDTDEAIDNALNYFADKTDLGEGQNVAYEHYKMEGDNYLIRDYVLTPDNSIPWDVEQDSRGFQVIIKGRERGQERYVTTYANTSISGALGEARGLMSQYQDFEGDEVIVRTFVYV